MACTTAPENIHGSLLGSQPAGDWHGPQVLCGSHRFDPFGVWGDPVPKPVVMAVNGIAFIVLRARPGC